jgi:hypothetical protein
METTRHAEDVRVGIAEMLDRDGGEWSWERIG